MAGKRGKPSVRVEADAFSFDCELAQPLGYLVWKPLDGRALDQVLLDATTKLGLRPGDRFTITLDRRGTK